jgi:pimeloyl-ACP methyl ester carboxylesterase
MRTLSTVPINEWLGQFSAEDRAEARQSFGEMASGSGFIIDLRQGRATAGPDRRAALAQVTCPTLITGSRYDGGVAFAYATSLAASIPHAELVELDTPHHLFWIGPTRPRLASLIASFLPE